jgi:hypothetical protein
MEYESRIDLESYDMIEGDFILNLTMIAED